MAAIIEPGSNVESVEEIAESGVIVDARDYFRAFHRSALQARRHILLAGWQFDHRVKLLRGADAGQAEGPVELLPLLDWLCERNPALRIYIRAWDFAEV